MRISPSYNCSRHRVYRWGYAFSRFAGPANETLYGPDVNPC